MIDPLKAKYQLESWQLGVVMARALVHNAAACAGRASSMGEDKATALRIDLEQLMLQRIIDRNK